MVMKLIKTINVILAIAAVLLIINLIYPFNTLAGNVAYNLDKSDPECYFSNAGESAEIPINNCCYEIYNQLACERTDETSGLRCFVSKTSDKFYIINNKALSYCKKEGYALEFR